MTRSTPAIRALAIRNYGVSPGRGSMRRLALTGLGRGDHTEIIDHCAHTRPVIHFHGGTWRQTEPNRRKPSPFRTPFPAPQVGEGREGRELVLVPGICHVQHRTVLLSQLVIQNARADHPNTSAGSAAGGEGASDGGEKAATGRRAVRRLPARADRPQAQHPPFPPLAGEGREVLRGGWRRNLDARGSRHPRGVRGRR